MTDFYSLSPEKQLEGYGVLARRALHEWDIDHDAELKLIKFRENAVFSVSTGSRQYAMRIHRYAYHSDDAVRSELQWMSALNVYGLRTPPIIPTSDGQIFTVVQVSEVPEPRQVDLFGWVDGKALGSIEEGVGDIEKAVENFGLIGQLAARMHDMTAQWELPQGFYRQAWDETGFIGDDPLWGRFWEYEFLTDENRKLLDRACQKAGQDLETFGKGADRYGLIHADFLPENFLQASDGGVRIIDFDDCGFGWHMFDFATAMFFHAGEDYFDSLLTAMVDGYQSIRILPDEHLAQLLLFLFLRGTTYLGWIHTRKETETAKEMGPIVMEGVLALAAEYTQS